jgi:hypothetical protein
MISLAQGGISNIDLQPSQINFTVMEWKGLQCCIRAMHIQDKGFTSGRSAIKKQLFLFINTAESIVPLGWLNF